MKLYYLMMRFAGAGVTGMIALAETPEQARKECLKLLNNQVKKLRQNNSETSKETLKRIISFRRTLNNLHRKNRGDSILKIREISGALVTGYWIGLSDSEHICNIPTTWKEHPIGYIYSELNN